MQDMCFFVKGYSRKRQHRRSCGYAAFIIQPYPGTGTGVIIFCCGSHFIAAFRLLSALRFVLYFRQIAYENTSSNKNAIFLPGNRIMVYEISFGKIYENVHLYRIDKKMILSLIVNIGSPDNHFHGLPLPRTYSIADIASASLAVGAFSDCPGSCRTPHSYCAGL